MIRDTLGLLESWGAWSRGKVGPPVMRHCGSHEWRWTPPCGSTWDEQPQTRPAMISDDQARQVENAVLATGRRAAKLLVAIFVERNSLELAGVKARCHDVRLELGCAIRQVDDALAGSPGRRRTGDQQVGLVVWVRPTDRALGAIAPSGPARGPRCRCASPATPRPAGGDRSSSH
jgi:hypothetical protein